MLDQVGIRVLSIEDNEDDSTLVLDVLRRADYEILAAQCVATAVGLGEALAEHSWDVVICDYKLPDFSGLAALARVREHDPNLPVVVVSGAIGGEATLALVRAGAAGLVLKHDLERLPGAVEQALRDAENQRRRSAAEAALLDENRVSASLARVGQECAASLDHGDLLHRICGTTAEVLGCDCVYALSWNPEEQTFRVAAGHDEPEHWDRLHEAAFPLAVPAEYSAQLRRNGIIHMKGAALVASESSAAAAAEFAVTSGLLVPLWRGSELFGGLAAGYRRSEVDFESWQHEAAKGIAHLTSLALGNVDLLGRLIRSDHVKSEFVSTMSHELRTPLNHIIGFGDILLDEAELTADQRHMMRAIRSSSRDLLALVNGILDIQRFEGVSTAYPQGTDVAQLIRRLVTTTAAGADVGTLRVCCELPPELPVMHAHPAKLGTILQNLIDNAVKFTTIGSLTISAEAQRGGILFTVADTGAGIPPVILPTIFDAFHQGDASDTRQHGGVGLGLFIVQREVALMGGEVTVESEVGSGSTFRVWIPCEPPQPLESPAISDGKTVVAHAEILDAIGDLIYTVNLDHQLLYANRPFQEASGYRTDELSELSIEAVFHPKSRDTINKAHQRCVGGEVVEGLHVQCLAKDGHTVELTGSIRYHPPTHTPAFIQGVFQNVTEHNETRRQADSRERILEAMLESLPLGVWVIDAAGRYVYGNPAGRRIWGGARYVGLGDYDQYKTWSVADGQPIAPEDSSPARAVREGETTVDEEVEIETFDGVRKTILNSAIPLRDTVGKITGAIVVNHDITAVKQLERSLRESEERFKLAIAGSNDGIWDVDLLQNKSYASPRCGTMLGLPAVPMLGGLDHWQSLLHPDDSERVVAAVTAHLEGTTQFYECEQRVRHEDGTYRWILVRGVALRNESGDAYRIAGSMTDITERNALNEALRRSGKQYRLLVENITDVIYTTDRNGRVTFMSPAACQLLGYESTELTEWPAQELVFPDDLPAATDGFRQAIAGRPRPHTYRVVTKSGEVRWVQDRPAPIFEGGEITGLQGILSDVTQQHGAEQSSHALTERLEGQVAERTRDLIKASRRLQMITENISDLVCQLSVDAVYEYVSPSHEWVLGYAPEQLLGKPALDFVHPDDAPLITAAVKAALGGAGSVPVTYRYRHADGHYVMLESDSVIVRDDGGTSVGAVITGRDITARRRAQESLEAHARQQAALADLGERALANADLPELLQTAVTIVAGVLCVDLCNLLELLPGGDALLLRAGVGWNEGSVGHAIVGAEKGSHAAYTLASHQPVVIEDLRSENRFSLPPLLSGHGVLSSMSVVIPTRHRPYGVLGAHAAQPRAFSSDDVNFFRSTANLLANAIDREQTNAEIRATNAGLEERVHDRTDQLHAANKELETFSYSISHDLRAPLRRIDGFSLALLEGHADQLDPEGTRCLGRIRAGTARMAQLIDDLLSFSQVQRSELRRTSVNLSDLARKVAADLRMATPERAVDVVIADGVVAYGDASLLQVVLQNLLDNAWKYTSNHAAARIEFGVTEHCDQTAYFVRDDGAGFDMEHADNLFRPFNRLHAECDFEGTGIGLAIVHRIVHRHGGCIWAEATLQAGATFYFTISPAPSIDLFRQRAPKRPVENSSSGVNLYWRNIGCR